VEKPKKDYIKDLPIINKKVKPKKKRTKKPIDL